MKFRKKPVVIEAFRWTGGPDQEEDPVWIVDAIKKELVKFRYNCLVIKTLEGVMCAEAGDWIIQGVDMENLPLAVFIVTLAVFVIVLSE